MNICMPFEKLAFVSGLYSSSCGINASDLTMGPATNCGKKDTYKEIVKKSSFASTFSLYTSIK